MAKKRVSRFEPATLGKIRKGALHTPHVARLNHRIDDERKCVSGLTSHTAGPHRTNAVPKTNRCTKR
ncbi:hypothetical protein M885DRAFT_514191 [Pelagophyceae sp. CCMP2097]|nr:hypothetical protein M885DRAFT_514191 [Pelagophyceae sp. CCMP2097]